MSTQNQIFEHLVTEMAHRAAADRLRQEGFNDAAQVLDQMVSAAYGAHQAAVVQRNAAVAQRDAEIEKLRLERIALRWASADTRPKPLLNPRQKNFAHRVPLKAEPDDAWLIDNIRVPFRFYKEGDGQLFFTSRCPREAAAVKMRWG